MTFMAGRRLSTPGTRERSGSLEEPTTETVAVAIAGASAIGTALVFAGLTYVQGDGALAAVVVIALLCLGAFAAFVYNWRSDASLLGSIGIAWAASCVTVGVLFVIPLSGALFWIFLLSGWWSILEVLVALVVVLAGAIVGRAIAWCVP